MIAEQTFHTGTVAINDAQGPPSGPPLVLLHGGGDRWQQFLPLLPSLTLRWQVYALYHVQGRIGEYVQSLDLDAALEQVTCPTLLLQGDPSRGGRISDDDAQHTLALLADRVHVRLENAGHDLGLGAWEVAPLLQAMTGFLESL